MQLCVEDIRSSLLRLEIVSISFASLRHLIVVVPILCEHSRLFKEDYSTLQCDECHEIQQKCAKIIGNFFIAKECVNLGIINKKHFKKFPNLRGAYFIKKYPQNMFHRDLVDKLIQITIGCYSGKYKFEFKFLTLILCSHSYKNIALLL